MKIAFIGHMKSPFIQRDYDLLKNNYTVYKIPMPEEKHKFPLCVIKLFFAVKKSDVLISEFASWNSACGVMFARLFKKKSIIVIGGIDASYVPECGYGFFCRFIPKRIALYCYHHANKFITVGPSLKNDIIKNAKISGEKIECIPRGHDSYFWIPSGKPKEKMVVTVASVKAFPRYHIKGVDVFLKVAKQMPDVKFIVIGLNDKMKRIAEKDSSPNITIINYSSQEVILSYFQRAKVYCQLSVREGFGNSLAESMLCECTGVSSDIETLRFVMGETGFHAPYGDVGATVNAIRKALSSSDDDGKKARLQALQFSDENRIIEFKKIIHEVMNKK